MLRRTMYYVVSVVVALGVSHCSNLSPTSSGASGTGNQAKSFANLDEEVLIDLPSSVAISRNGMAKQSGRYDATPSDAIAIYDGIRRWVGLADELVNNGEFGVRAMILFWRDTLNWKYVEEAGEVTGTEGNYQWTASYSEESTHAYRLVIRALSEVPKPVALEINFNGDFQSPAGDVYYNVELLDPASIRGGELMVTFEKTTSMRSIDILMTTKSPGSNSEEFQKGKLSLREKDGIVHLSGSSYHPNIDSVLPGVTGHCYTFTGVVDTLANQAIVNLGLPPADHSGTDDLFTTYGLSEMFSQSILLQEIPRLDDSLKMVVATSYKDSMTVEEIIGKVVLSGSTDFLRDASEIESMTVDQYTYFLELNQSISDPEARADISALLWISALEQPVYFNSIGYAGNGETVPAGFNALASTTCILDPLAPSSIKDLSIDR